MCCRIRFAPRVWLLLLVMVFVIPARAAGTEPCFHYEEWSAELGSVVLDRECVAIYPFGDYAYAQVGGWGTWSVRLLDIGDGTAPREVGPVFTDLSVTSMGVRGNRAYLLARDSLLVFDISDPPSPRCVGQSPADGSAWYLTLGGSRLWITRARGTQIYDLTNPDAPALMGEIPAASSWPASYFSDSLAVIPAFGGRTAVFDVRDPAHPILVNYLPRSSEILGLALHRGYLFAAEWLGTVSVIDFRHPEAPIRLSTLFFDPSDMTVAVEGTGDTLLVTTPGEVLAYDLSEPTRPRALGSHAGGRVSTLFLQAPLAVHGSKLLLPDREVVHVVDRSLLRDAPPIGTVPAGDEARELLLENERLYEVGMSGEGWTATAGFKIFDVSDPLHPALVGKMVEPGQNSGYPALAKRGNHVYLVHRGDIRVIDVSEPTVPRLVREVHTRFWTWGLVNNDELLVASGLRDSAEVYRMMDDGSLEPVANWALSGRSETVLLGDTLAVMADPTGGATIASIRDPKRPVQLARVPGTSEIAAMAIEGTELYLLDELSVLTAVDLSGPRMPVVQGQLQLPEGSSGLAVFEGVGWTNAGLHVWALDVRDPEEMRVAGRVRVDGGTTSLTAGPGGVVVGGDVITVLPGACIQAMVGVVTELIAETDPDKILLSWQVASGRFAGFLVRRADLGGADPSAYQTQNADLPVPGEGPWIWLDRTVSPGSAYLYMIRALRGDGSWIDFGPTAATTPSYAPISLDVQPNPFRGDATLRFLIPRAAAVRVDMFDPAGRRVGKVFRDQLGAGLHTIPGFADGERSLPPGVYFVRLSAGGDVVWRRAVRLGERRRSSAWDWGPRVPRITRPITSARAVAAGSPADSAAPAGLPRSSS